MATNLTSTDSELGSDFRFELGGFAAGFQPSSANAREWRENWVAVGSADYNASLRFFAASTEITQQSAGFGGPAYIWGFNREAIGGDAEWVLLTNSNWVLPSSGTSIAPPQQWSTGTATTAVLGSVNAQPGVHLRTASVGGSASVTPTN